MAATARLPARSVPVRARTLVPARPARPAPTPLILPVPTVARPRVAMRWTADPARRIACGWTLLPPD